MDDFRFISDEEEKVTLHGVKCLAHGGDLLGSEELGDWRLPSFRRHLDVDGRLALLR